MIRNFKPTSKQNYLDGLYNGSLSWSWYSRFDKFLGWRCLLWNISVPKWVNTTTELFLFLSSWSPLLFVSLPDITDIQSPRLCGPVRVRDQWTAKTKTGIKKLHWTMQMVNFSSNIIQRLSWAPSQLITLDQAESRDQEVGANKLILSKYHPQPS